MEAAEFYDGIAFDAYEVLGSHPCRAAARGRRGWDFCVYAPHARRVQVVGDWNHWNLYRAAELARGGDGFWHGSAAGARAGQLYKYNIQGADGVWRLRADPYAFAAEPPPGTASRLAEPGFGFTDAAWMAARGPGFDAPMNIYELHAGGWRRHRDGRYFTYAELAAGLIPWLRRQHYTHVEFMPLAEHPFEGSWGYQGTGFFAPTARFGSPANFCGLVNALHRAGIGVLMDFVPVHFALDEGFLSDFDGGPLYEFPGKDGHSPWGSRFFDWRRPEVRSFLLSAAAFWLHCCHCDGLRVDAVGTALNHPAGGGAAAEFFKTLAAGLHARCPGVALIAENTAPGQPATAPTATGGLGFDYCWDGEGTRAALAVFTAPFADREAAAADLKRTIDSGFGENFIRPLSHDESCWQSATLLYRFQGSYEEKFSQARLFYLYLYAIPGKPLDFMGNEWGHFRAFDPCRALDWPLLHYPAHADLLAYRAALGALYRCHPALWCEPFNPACFRWVAVAGEAGSRAGILAWLRMAAGEVLLCVLNLTAVPCPGTRLNLREFCRPLRLTPIFAAGPGQPPPRRQTADGWYTLDLPPLAGYLLGIE